MSLKDNMVKKKNYTSLILLGIILGLIIIVVAIVSILNTLERNERVFGVNIHRYGDNQTIEYLKTLGAKSVRCDFSWGSNEKQRGVYNFSEDDKIINAYFGAGIEPLPIIGVTNSLYPSYSCTNSTQNDIYIKAFGNYTYAVVSHFKGKVKYYEIINEVSYIFCPDPFNKRIGTVEGALLYGKLLREVSNRAKEADPNVKIVFSGLGDPGYTIDTWYSNIYLYGYNKYFDILGVHYTTASQMQTLRKLMVQYGDGNKPIWVTEFGTPTDGCYFNSDTKLLVSCGNYSEEKQSNYISNYINSIKNMPYVERVFLYQFRESCGNNSRRFDMTGCANKQIVNEQCPIDVECRFGITNTDYSYLKQGFSTYQQIINEKKN
jgi:hypothetical protein